MPEPHAIAAMVLTLVALVLFMRDKIPLETSSMVVIAALALGFELFPYDARRQDPARGRVLPRLRPRGAGRRLRADDRRPGPGAHRRARAAGPGAGRAVARRARCRRCFCTLTVAAALQRLRQQHADRRAAAADPDQRLAAHPHVALGRADADGLRHPDRRHGHDHRHLDQPAGGLGRGGPGPAPIGMFDFILPATMAGVGRHPVPGAGRPAPAARAQHTADRRVAARVHRAVANPRRQLRRRQDAVGGGRAGPAATCA